MTHTCRVSWHGLIIALLIAGHLLVEVVECSPWGAAGLWGAFQTDAWKGKWSCSVPMDEALDSRWYGAPMRFNGADVECASLNGRSCWTDPRLRCRDKLKYIQQGRVRVLRCGQEHQAIWQASGYAPGHWCQAALAFYRDPDNVCKKYYKVLVRNIGGCAVDGDLCGDKGPWLIMNRCKSKHSLVIVHATRQTEASNVYGGWTTLKYGQTDYQCSDLYSRFVYVQGRLGFPIQQGAVMCSDQTPAKGYMSRYNPCVVDGPPDKPWGVAHTRGTAGAAYTLTIYRRNQWDQEQFEPERSISSPGCDGRLHASARLPSGQATAWDGTRSSCLEPILVFTEC